MAGFAFNKLTSALRFGEDGQTWLAGSMVGVAHQVCGTARVVSNESQLSGLLEGEIVIAETCPPQWRAQLVLARAVIIESDSHASHLIRTSHELDLPIVIGVKGLLSQVRTGMVVACSADGVLQWLEERRDPDSPMRIAWPGARQSRLRLAEGPGHFAAAASLSVVDGAPDRCDGN